MNILVLNAGSSSIKYRLYNFSSSELLLSGLVEHIGEPIPVKHTWQDSTGENHIVDLGQKNFAAVFECLFDEIVQSHAIGFIGHRVVHGGESSAIVKINQPVLNNLRQTIPLAPLHNPANINGIELSLKYFPGVDQFAVFDTAFHQTMPDYAYHYALPLKISDQFKIRRYGFHGISHKGIAKTIATHLNKPLAQLNLISLHLGNGASAAAIKQGQCVDTSMGMTPLEGLIMGSRCGDIDPGILLLLLRQGYNEATLSELLNQQSGLKGLCGSNDMREICTMAEKGQASAQLAINMYCYRIKKIIGAYSAILGRVDALAFSGGIGEHSASIRAEICDGLDNLGIELDKDKNSQAKGRLASLQKSNRTIAVVMVKSDEELEIANQIKEFLAIS